jgi:hypothetical protein
MLLLLHAAVDSSQMPIGPMPTARASLIESSTVPSWLYAFSSVQLELAGGMRLELVEMAVVSSEQQRRAALIGMLRNRSEPLTGAALKLLYVGQDGQSIVASASNTALVSDIPADGLLPFRFSLLPRAALPNDPLSLRISVLDEVADTRRLVPARMRPNYSVRGRGGDGALLKGEIETFPEDSVQHAEEERLLVTIVLFDGKGRLLDLLAGSPMSRLDVNTYQVEFGSFLPIGGRVKSVQAYVETESGDK